ncbi:MAG: methylenetetrahydrofolate reductase [NAD(P)H] [Alphaproteobacteria bacterium]
MPESFRYSFEFFPPKTPAQSAQLWETVDHLLPLRPQFVSVTFGAGGSTREKTRETVLQMMHKGAQNVTPHLTCVGLSKDDIHAIADDYWQHGVRSLVGLRGDMPERTMVYAPHPEGYPYAADLITGLRQRHDFDIKVSAYPEKHPESPSLSQDIDVLKRKQDAGATQAITQFFFDVDVYSRFVDAARKAGLTIPIVPGLLAMHSFPQAKAFAAFCGTSVPPWVDRWFAGFDQEPANHHLAAHLLMTQCETLFQRGVRDFHFYTLNRWPLVSAAVQVLRAQS